MAECIFCKIIQKEIPSKIIYEDDKVVAFKDINPKAPIHVLVIPKKHISSLIEIDTQDANLLGYLLLKIQEITKTLKLDTSGYKIIANNGKAAGQLVFHLHFHVLGGWNSNPDWNV